MLNFQGFTDADFSVFEVEGLEQRMERLKQTLRPKLEQIGADLAPFLSKLTDTPMFAHVAKHARRKTNPPQDSWVAWSHNPRGYKMYPHFQVGAWASHAFIQWGIIYESSYKSHFGEKMKLMAHDLLKMIPPDYTWYPDHTVNRGLRTSEMHDTDLLQLANRLTQQKNGELMIGINLSRAEAAGMKPEEFLRIAQDTFHNLAVLHKAALSSVEISV